MRFTLQICSLALLGCVEPVAAPLGDADSLHCRSEHGAHFFAVIGYNRSYLIHIDDTRPNPAQRWIDVDGLEQITLEGETACCTYLLKLENTVVLSPGDIPLMYEANTAPDGMVMRLTVSRPGLGREELSSVAGTLSVEKGEHSVLTAGFQASLGAPDNHFEGCFCLAIEDGVPDG